MRLIKMAALAACLFMPAKAAIASDYDPTTDLDYFVEILVEPDSIARIDPDGNGGEYRTVRIDVGAVSVSFVIHTVAGSLACVIESTELYRASPLVQMRDEGCDGSLDRVWHATDHGRDEQPLTVNDQLQYVRSVQLFTDSFWGMLSIIDPSLSRVQIATLMDDVDVRRARGAEYETRLRNLIENEGAGGPNYAEHGYQVRFFGNSLVAHLRYDHVPHVGLRLFAERAAGDFVLIDANGDHMPDIMEQPSGTQSLGLFQTIGVEQPAIEAGTVHMLDVLSTLAESEVQYLSNDDPTS